MHKNKKLNQERISKRLKLAYKEEVNFLVKMQQWTRLSLTPPFLGIQMSIR